MWRKNYNRAERQFTLNTVNRGQKKPAEKNPTREKTRQEIWVGSVAHALKSTSYEGYTAERSLPLFTKMYSNKARKTLNNFRKRKQAKKPLRNSNCH